MANKKENEVKDKITISIPKELYDELSEVAKKNRKSIQHVIEVTLGYAEFALREEKESKKERLLKVGDPLEYGPLRYWLRAPLRSEEKEKPQSNQLKEKQK